MILGLIVAMSENRVIGNGNRLPWHLPEDLRHFKAVTMGKPLIMGRKTYESIGRPLPGRTILVVTRQPGWRAEGVEVFGGIEAALARARELAPGDAEALVAGGEDVYRQCLPLVQRLYITEVGTRVEGDARFPMLESGQWRETASESGYSQRAGLHYRLMTLVRP